MLLSAQSRRKTNHRFKKSFLCRSLGTDLTPTNWKISEPGTIQFLGAESTGSSVIQTWRPAHLRTRQSCELRYEHAEWRRLSAIKDCRGGCRCELSGF